MRLRLRHLLKDRNKVERNFEPLDLSHIFEDDDVLSEWLDDPGDALLDEIYDEEQPPRPNTFLATWAERLCPTSTDAIPNKGKKKVIDVQGDDEFDDFETIGGEHDLGVEDNMNQNINDVSQKSIYFTKEQDFEYCTQDEDHGSRRSRCLGKHYNGLVFFSSCYVLSYFRGFII